MRGGGPREAGTSVNARDQLKFAALLMDGCQRAGLEIVRPRMRSGNVGGYVPADYQALVGWIMRGGWSIRTAEASTDPTQTPLRLVTPSDAQCGK